LSDNLDLFGCDSAANHKNCKERGWTCFCNPHLFAERYSEVGGFQADLRGALVVPKVEMMPMYIPTIFHSGSRTETLNLHWAALPLDSVIRKRRDGQFRAVATDARSLRAQFNLADSTKIIVTSVRPDPVIEQFWRYHQSADAPSVLAELGIDAITVPNFSFFDDCPRPHILYNWSRMLRIAERFSSAGLGTVLHLNALTMADWRRWERILRDHPHVRFVCKEFQTGLRKHDRGEEAYAQLVNLQAQLGRSLHPILIAGRRFLPKLALDFPGSNFTVIDATPFMRTYYRRGLESTRNTQLKWRPRKTKVGESLHLSLAATIQSYQTKLERVVANVSQQPELGLKVFPVQRCRGFRITPLEDLPLFANGRQKLLNAPPTNSEPDPLPDRNGFPSRNSRGNGLASRRIPVLPTRRRAATPPN
jgi:hypothetical protein